MRRATDIIRGLRQTEKGTRIAAYQQFVVDVASNANKVEIRQAVEQLFNVKVRQVNTHTAHGKWRRLSVRWGKRPDRKRAIVTLDKGQKLELKG